MRRPNFQEKTEVKVVDKDYREYTCIKGVEKTAPMYGWRGTVKEIIGFDANWTFIEKPYSFENYPSNWEVIAEFKSPADGEKYTMSFRDWPNQLEPVQRKFVDIDYIREEDLVIGKKDDGTDAVRPKNTDAFEPGDLISITTKIDGANASIAWDETTGKLPAELGPKDMVTVMKHLPKRVFDDVLKEERDVVSQIGEGAGKFISAEAAKQARKIVIGG